MNQNDYKIKFDTSSPIADNVLEHYARIKKMDLGWFGQIFGNSENAPTSICGMLIFFLVIMISVMFCFDKNITLELAKSIALPIITCSLGYLFGKKH